MNMGRRIADRLNDLGWKQKELLARVPDLTPQTLSNLVRRDSRRSDWEREIAEALGVSVAWLVYGQEDGGAARQPAIEAAPLPAEPSEPAPLIVVSASRLPPPALSADEMVLVDSYRVADVGGRAALIAMAKALLDTFGHRKGEAKKA